jgi:RNase P/RNase MRP subunit p29
MSKKANVLVLPEGMDEQTVVKVINSVDQDREGLNSNYVRDEKPLILEISAEQVDKSKKDSRYMEFIIDGVTKKCSLGRGADPKTGVYSLWRVKAKKEIPAGEMNGIKWGVIAKDTPALRLYPVGA